MNFRTQALIIRGGEMIAEYCKATEFSIVIQRPKFFMYVSIGVASLGPGGARAPPDFLKIKITYHCVLLCLTQDEMK